MRCSTSDGKTYPAEGRRSDGLNVVAPLHRTLPRGAYTVRWHVLSADGHVVSGVWTFGVRVKAPPPTEAFGAGGPTRTEHVVRWLYFLSFALLIGSLGFRLILARRSAAGRGREAAVRAVAGSGVIAAIEIGIVAFCLRCEDVLQLPFGKFVYGDLSPIADGTRFGKAFVVMTLGFAFVAAFVYLAWLLDRPVLLLPALVLVGRAAVGALALGARRGRPRLVEGDRARRLGAHLGGVARGSAGCWRSRSPSGRSRRSCGARRSSASRGSRSCSSGSCSRRGRTSRSSGCRISPTSGRSATARCCS